jgi:hypothetical protein
VLYHRFVPDITVASEPEVVAIFATNPILGLVPRKTLPEKAEAGMMQRK